MIGEKRPLDLSVDSRLVLNGQEWAVASFLPHVGRVQLRNSDGQELATTVRVLINHPDCRPVPSSAELPAYDRGRQLAGLDDLTDHQRRIVAIRYTHVMEAETGYRSGDWLRALPGEPRPDYDPDTTTLTQRRQAKVAELRALPADEARMLGLARVSVRTLIRWSVDSRHLGVAGCISGNWLRRSGDRPAITPQIREAIFAVRQETLHRSLISMKAKAVLIHQYVLENFGPDIPVPASSNASSPIC